jgi:hypothetical protein
MSLGLVFELGEVRSHDKLSMFEIGIHGHRKSGLGLLAVLFQLLENSPA